MINLDYKELKGLEKLMRINKIINSKLKRLNAPEIQPRVMRHIADYINVNKQYYVDVYNDKQKFMEQLYVGYSIKESDSEYSISRDFLTCVYGNCCFGYKQRNEVLFNPYVFSDFVVVIRTTNIKGYNNSGKGFAYETPHLVVYSNLKRGATI